MGTIRKPMASAGHTTLAGNRDSPSNLALLVTAIGQISEAIVITDISGTIEFVNPAFSKMTGYSAAETIGQSTRLLKSGRQDPAFYRELWNTILSGEVWQGELHNRRKDGTFYTDRMSIAPVRSDDGVITNFIAIKQDVTERRVTEAALHASERSLEDVQHIVPMGSWELDAQASQFLGSEGFFRIVDMNPVANRLPFAVVRRLPVQADRYRKTKRAHPNTESFVGRVRPVSYCSTETTVTDLGSSCRINLPPCAFAEIGLGTTELGASKVFTLSTLGAVNVSPEADLTLIPLTFNSTSAACLGSTFVISTHSLPSLLFAAMASTRGKAKSPCL